jgi:hypothetical protein
MPLRGKGKQRKNVILSKNISIKKEKINLSELFWENTIGKNISIIPNFQRSLHSDYVRYSTFNYNIKNENAGGMFVEAKKLVF